VSGSSLQRLHERHPVKRKTMEQSAKWTTRVLGGEFHAARMQHGTREPEPLADFVDHMHWKEHLEFA